MRTHVQFFFAAVVPFLNWSSLGKEQEAKNSIADHLSNDCPDEVIELAAAGIDAPSRDSPGHTPLMLASTKSLPTCVDGLILVGADVNVANEKGVTALMYAAAFACPRCVESLIQAGADVNARDSLRRVALMLAARTGSPDVLKRLIVLGSKEATVAGGSAESIALLLDAGADANARNVWARTALMYASAGGCSGCVDHLLKAGADINAQGTCGVTMSMVAAYHGCNTCLEMAAAAGANFDIQDAFGWSTLIWAAESCKETTIEKLLDLEASRFPRDYHGKSAYDQAELECPQRGHALSPAILAQLAVSDKEREESLLHDPRLWRSVFVSFVLAGMMTGFTWCWKGNLCARNDLDLRYSVIDPLAGDEDATLETVWKRGARRAATIASVTPMRLLGVRVFRFAEVLSNVAVPMALMCFIRPSIMLSLLALLYIVPGMWSNDRKLMKLESLTHKPWAWFVTANKESLLRDVRSWTPRQRRMMCLGLCRVLIQPLLALFVALMYRRLPAWLFNPAGWALTINLLDNPLALNSRLSVTFAARSFFTGHIRKDSAGIAAATYMILTAIVALLWCFFAIILSVRACARALAALIGSKIGPDVKEVAAQADEIQKLVSAEGSDARTLEEKFPDVLVIRTMRWLPERGGRGCIPFPGQIVMDLVGIGLDTFLDLQTTHTLFLHGHFMFGSCILVGSVWSIAVELIEQNLQHLPAECKKSLHKGVYTQRILTLMDRERGSEAVISSFVTCYALWFGVITPWTIASVFSSINTLAIFLHETIDLERFIPPGIQKDEGGEFQAVE
mmetsp:Transcript_38856/g.70758  ORF Transcript_38856/g.70758 Transcript_38856/m.70758 type:complete len:795 (-) Transcript_38856:15-2399(-)